MYSLIKHLLSTYYVQDTILGSEDTQCRENHGVKETRDQSQFWQFCDFGQINSPCWAVFTY